MLLLQKEHSQEVQHYDHQLYLLSGVDVKNLHYLLLGKNIYSDYDIYYLIETYAVVLFFVVEAKIFKFLILH